MSRLKQKLLKALENAKRVAILGIGSELRGDDAVGLLVLEHLRKLKTKSVQCHFHGKFKSTRGRAGQPVPPFVSVGQGCPTLPLKKNPLRRPNLRLFNGGTAPENLTGEIRRFKPDHLIMIDAVELGKRPGTIALVDIKKVESTAFLTHKLPLKLMLDYMAAEMSFTTIFIGIQPRALEFEGKISKPVIRAGRQTADLLLSALKASSCQFHRSC